MKYDVGLNLYDACGGVGLVYWHMGLGGLVVCGFVSLMFGVVAFAGVWCLALIWCGGLFSY